MFSSKASTQTETIFPRSLVEEQQQKLSKKHRFLFMRFEPSLEAAFEEFRYLRLLKRLPIICVTGLVLFFLFSILDYYTLPEPAYLISIPIRLFLICPLICLLLYLGWKRVPSQLFFNVYFGVYLISAAGIMGIIVAADFYEHFLPYDGILLHLVFGYFIMCLPYLIALYGGLTVTLIYTVMSQFTALPLDLLLSNCIFILSLNFIGAIGCYMQERARRFLFLNENLVAIAKAKDRKEIASKTRLVATASHDLRQPLNAIHLLVEALKDQLPEGQQRNLARSIDISIKQLSHLLGTLLDISKLNAGIIEPRPEPVNLYEKIAHLCDEQTLRAKATGVQLSFDGDAMVYVYADSLLLNRIIRNVVENIFVHAQASTIKITWQQLGKSVRLEILDDGIGIPEEDLTDIFEEFHQSGDQTNSGMGLGLTIVKQLSELQGIDYGLSSSKGKGACFWFWLPLAEGKNKRNSVPTISVTMFKKEGSDLVDRWAEQISNWGYELTTLAIGTHMSTEHIAKVVPNKTQILVWDVLATENITEVVSQAKALRQRIQDDLPILFVVDESHFSVPFDWPENQVAMSERIGRSVRPGKFRLVLSHLAGTLSAANSQ